MLTQTGETIVVSFLSYLLVGLFVLVSLAHLESTADKQPLLRSAFLQLLLWPIVALDLLLRRKH